MKLNWKTWLRWLVSIFSIGLLIWTLRELDIAQIFAVLAGAKYAWIMPAVAVYFCAVWIRTLRWRILLKPIKRISLSKLFPIICIGYMGNNVYPARAGEILRAYILKEREDYPISSSFMTIVVERIFDGIVVLAFVFFTFPLLTSLIGGDVDLITRWAVVLTVIFSLVLIFLVLLVLLPGLTQKIFQWVEKKILPAKWRGKAAEVFSKLIKGLESLRSPKEAALVLLTTIVIWLVETCTYWLVAQAFSLDLSFYALMMLNGAINLFTLIPAAPGYFGTFELAGKTLVSAYRIAADIATGFILILHVTLWLPITLVGAIFLFWNGFGIRKARESVMKDPPLD